MIPYSKDNKVLANNLRNNMTKYEKRLWYDCLRFFPTRFIRQKRLGNYIADFYCHKAKLVIELDGEQHYNKDVLKYDQIRSIFLEQYDLYVLRIINYDLSHNFNGLCEHIENVVKERLLQFGYSDDLWNEKEKNLSVS